MGTTPLLSAGTSKLEYYNSVPGVELLVVSVILMGVPMPSTTPDSVAHTITAPAPPPDSW